MAINSNMRFRYANNPRTGRRSIHLRRFQDPVLHEKFYAFLKHKAQARFRGEPYRLTWEDWCDLWTDRLWPRRGRGPHSLRLTLRDPAQGWSRVNCEIVPHATHMSRITRERARVKQNQQS